MGSEETRIYGAIVVTSVLIGSIFIYLIYFVVRMQRRNLHLQRRNSLAEVTAMEKERQRIATDLHDEIAPYLADVRLRISAFEMANKMQLAERNLVAKKAADLLERIREISFDLMPSALLSKGLVSAIKGIVSRTKKNSNIDIVLASEKYIELNEQQAINVFRIVLEILHNAIKHSGATEIVIALNKQEGMLELKMVDNGAGFDYDEAIRETTGFGLRSIQNRTESMGGKLFVQTAKGKGLSYIIEIPIT